MGVVHEDCPDKGQCQLGSESCALTCIELRELRYQNYEYKSPKIVMMKGVR
jgi:hypothetical protein